MATTSVNVSGTAGVKANIFALGEQIRRETALVVARYALLVEREAKAFAPVETGALRDSIRHVLEGMSARVIAGEGLPDIRAIVQELGSVKQAAQPYLIRALEAHRAAFVRDLEAALRGVTA